MADDIQISKKVQTTGISQQEFVDKMKEKGIEENAAKSIFGRFNTNTTGDSAEVLDQNEQIGFMAFLKKLANGDEQISEAAYNANTLGDDIGFDTFSKSVTAYNELIDADTSDNKEVEFSAFEGGTIIYTKDASSVKHKFDDSANFQEIETTDGDTSISQKMRTKRSPVRLSSAWRMQRGVAESIASNAEGYQDIKSQKTAEQVLDKILQAKNITVEDATKKQQLLQTFINFNPSIFDKESGAVWVDADWSKLDFPAVTDIDAMLAEDEVEMTGGTEGTPLTENSEEVEQTPPTPQYTYNSGIAHHKLQTKEASLPTITQTLYDIADDNSGGKAVKKMLDYIKGNIDESNILEVYNHYIENQGDDSLMDTITSEWLGYGNGHGRDYAMQSAKYLLECLIGRAEAAGINPESSQAYKNALSGLQDLNTYTYHYVNDKSSGTSFDTKSDNGLTKKVDPLITALISEISALENAEAPEE
ncbi:MAG: hypothetical protein NC200_03695 [Candidatus Gastranaerophilales bacterium]|nr:hypothetical protein [Candidatus Gastranaerophilales bacterium]